MQGTTATQTQTAETGIELASLPTAGESIPTKASAPSQTSAPTILPSLDLPSRIHTIQKFVQPQ
jgi:hypothetical protein